MTDYNNNKKPEGRIYGGVVSTLEDSHSFLKYVNNGFLNQLAGGDSSIERKLFDYYQSGIHNEPKTVLREAQTLDENELLENLWRK
jgi:hypothetical protein